MPLSLVSKTLRHSKMAITVELYGHLTIEAAHAASDALATALGVAPAERAAERKIRAAPAVRPHARDDVRQRVIPARDPQVNALAQPRSVSPTRWNSLRSE